MKQKKKRETIEEQVSNKMDEIQAGSEVEVENQKPIKPLSAVELVDHQTLRIEQATFTIAVNERDAIQLDAIADRYNDILAKYDYIVGDWGYDQLRLKGFYAEDNRRAPIDKKISFLQDYLYEFCNFGCAYFVLERERSVKVKRSKPKRKKTTDKAHTSEAVKEVTSHKKEFVISNKRQKSTSQKENPRSEKPEQKKKAPNTSFQIQTKE